MKLNERLDKFEKLVSDKPSNFLSKLAYYKANKNWIDQSSKVAINVLETLRAKGLSQKDLAEKMNVSAQQVNKIIKGKQNLTFETVGKLENALGISLMEIIDYRQIAEIKTSATQIKSVQTSFIKEVIIRSNLNPISSSVKPQMRVVHKKMTYSKSHNLFAKAN